jgi:hypothetical protein
MIDWLKGGSGDFHEQPAKLYTNQELQVTRSGNVSDEPGSRRLYQLILDELHRKKRPGTISELLAELRRLGVPSEGPPPAVKIINDSNTQDYRLDQVRFEGEPGAEIAICRGRACSTRTARSCRRVRAGESPARPGFRLHNGSRNRRLERRCARGPRQIRASAHTRDCDTRHCEPLSGDLSHRPYSSIDYRFRPPT